MDIEESDTPQQPGQDDAQPFAHETPPAEQSHRIHHQESHRHFVEQQQFNLMAQHRLQQQQMREETRQAYMEGMQYSYEQHYAHGHHAAHPGPASHHVNLLPHPQTMRHASSDPQFYHQPPADNYPNHAAHGLPQPAPHPHVVQHQHMHVAQQQLGNLQTPAYQDQIPNQLQNPHTLPHAHQLVDSQQAQLYHNQQMATQQNQHVMPMVGGPMLNPNPAAPTVQQQQQTPQPLYGQPQQQQHQQQHEPPRARTIAWEELSNVAVLKHGSGTTVFSAELDGQAVAVKAPKHGLNAGSHKEVTMELRHEAKVLHNINHPHVIRFYGAGTVIVGDGHPVFFIVVEILAESLADRLKDKDKDLSGSQSYSQALELLFALSHAINHLHNECDPGAITIHRDLKPDNIGFTHDGTLKLFDFGLAAVIPRAVPADGLPQGGGRNLPRYRLTGQTGSVRYMAPEVALNQPYNERVDTYSYAMVAYEILSKRKPFHGMTVETHRQVVCRNGQRPQLDRARPQDLNVLFEACWAQDLDTRPDFSAVVQRVDLLLADARLGEEAMGVKKHGGVSASMIPRAFRSFGMSMAPKTTTVTATEPKERKSWF